MDRQDETVRKAKLLSNITPIAGPLNVSGWCIFCKQWTKTRFSVSTTAGAVARLMSSEYFSGDGTLIDAGKAEKWWPPQH